MKTGLILEGGAMRGLFTAGITDVFLENGITFDGTIGVSAGAAFGCNFKSAQIGRALRYNKKYCKDKRYCSVKSLIFTGDMFGADFCYHLLPEKLDLFDNTAYESNPMEFYVVATDIESGKAVYKKLDKATGVGLEWIRASASMPLASKIVEIEGSKYLDGGVADSIPLKFFESIGYEKNVVILTQPADYVKKANQLMPLIKMVYKKYPNLINAMEQRHTTYNKTIEYICKKEQNGEILVIRPDEKLPVDHVCHDPDVLQQVYDLGRNTALARLDEIKEFLKND